MRRKSNRCGANLELTQLKEQLDIARSIFNNATTIDEIESAVYLIQSCEIALNGFFKRIRS